MILKAGTKILMRILEPSFTGACRTLYYCISQQGSLKIQKPIAQVLILLIGFQKILISWPSLFQIDLTNYSTVFGNLSFHLNLVDTQLPVGEAAGEERDAGGELLHVLQQKAGLGR